MANLPELKAFKTVQKKLALVGICRELVTQPHPLNEKIAMGFLLLIMMMTLGCVFIFNCAETFYEYMQSIYGVSCAILFIFALLILALNVDQLFKYIDDWDITINTNKWNFTFRFFVTIVWKFEKNVVI